MPATVALPIATPQPLPPVPSLTPADVAEVRVYGTLGNAAIVSVGGKAQQRVAVGRQLLPGITIESTAPGHIIVTRGGARLKLPLLTFDGTAPAAQAVTGPEASALPKPSASAVPTLSRGPYTGEANMRKQTIAFQLGLVRRADAPGFTVRRLSTMPLLARAGLRDGDTIVAVNDGHFTMERLLELAYDVGHSTHMRISFERDGTLHTAAINLKD